MTKTLTPHHARARHLDLTTDGRLLARGTYVGRDVKVWDVSSGQVVKTIPCGNARVRFSPNGERLVVHEGLRCTVWRVSDWDVLHSATVDFGSDDPGPIAFSSDGRLLAVLTACWQVRLLDAETFAELVTMSHPEDRYVQVLSFSPDDSRLIAGTFQPRFVHIWDLDRIRDRLREIGLDWPHPPLAARNPTDSKPIVVKLDLAELTAPAPQINRPSAPANSSHERFERYADFERSLALKPDEAWCYRHLAWPYTIGPDELRRAERSVELAQQGVVLARREKRQFLSVFLDTLGLAYVRAGEHERALECLGESVAVGAPPRQAANDFIRAICHYHLDRIDEARSCYRAGMGRFASARPEWFGDYLSTLRDEAEKLLGSEDCLPPDKDQ